MEEKDDPEANNRVEFLDKAIDKSPRSGLYLFPILTNRGKKYSCDPLHWTLLVHDLGDKKWKLYGSLKPRRKTSQGTYKKDAKILPRLVEKFKKISHRRCLVPHHIIPFQFLRNLFSFSKHLHSVVNSSTIV